MKTCLLFDWDWVVIDQILVPRFLFLIVFFGHLFAAGSSALFMTPSLNVTPTSSIVAAVTSDLLPSK